MVAKDGDNPGHVEDQESWHWIPTVSYGPFVFGSEIASTPLLGKLIDVAHSGPISGDDVRHWYSSTVPGVELIFWDGYLTGVETDSVFVIGEIDVMRRDYRMISGSLGGRFEICDDLEYTNVVDYPEMELTITTDKSWTITSVSVGADPDLVVGVERTGRP